MDRPLKPGRIIARSLLALLVGAICGVFWIAWLYGAAVLGQVWLQAAALVIGPLAVAAGLTAGSIAYEQLFHRRRLAFGRLYPWPLAGCAFAAAMTRIGGTIVMLLGMLLLGVAALVIRDITLMRYNRPP